MYVMMICRYIGSQAGYDASEKRDELFDASSILLLVRTEGGSSLAAFAMFRFDEEETADDDVHADVVYW